MTDKQLKKMKRKGLLEIMVLQAEKIEEQEKQIAELQQKLEERDLKISQSGSLAEASLQVFDVVYSAQKAADLYIENIRKNEEESRQILKKATKTAEDTIENAKLQAQKIIEDSELHLAQMVNQAIEQAKEEHMTEKEQAAGPKERHIGLFGRKS